MCDISKPLTAFSSYAYTTRQGKRSARYESRCKACAVLRTAERWKKNRGKMAAQARQWRDSNREHIAVYNLERQQNPEHRALKAYHQRLRKARLRSGEGDDAAIRLIYQNAKVIEKLVANCPVFDFPELGHEMQVDHVVPLARGGRHIAENLQILPKGLNMRKGTRCLR